MSTESVIAFFGIRVEVEESEVEQLELRQHSLIVRARSASLQNYWGNFGEAEPKYVVLIGKKLSILGVENSAEFIVSQTGLIELMTDVRRKLESAGFDKEPELILQLELSS